MSKTVKSLWSDTLEELKLFQMVFSEKTHFHFTVYLNKPYYLFTGEAVPLCRELDLHRAGPRMHSLLLPGKQNLLVLNFLREFI